MNESDEEEDEEKDEEEDEEDDEEEDEEEEEEKESEGLHEDSMQHNYNEYESALDKSVKIIKSFNNCDSHFKPLEHQIPLLSCRTLCEVIEVLADHQAPSSSARGYVHPTNWKPEGCDAQHLIDDPRCKLNLPEEVIRIVGNAVRRLKDGIVETLSFVSTFTSTQ